MKLHRLLSVILLAFSLAAASARAEDSLTREEVRSLAISHSKTLQRKLLSVDSALLTEKIQTYSLWPSISANASAGASYPASSLTGALRASVGITVAQAIYSGGKFSILSAIDSLGTRIAREEAHSEYFNILQEADNAFSTMIEAESSVDAARSDLEAARTHQGLAEAKLEAGIITRSAYLKTELETAAAETSLTQAQGKLSVALAKLASLTGLALPLELESAEAASLADIMQRFAGFSEAQTNALIASVRSAASANNTSLAQARLTQQQAKSSMDLVKADYLPSVSATWSNALTYSTGFGASSGSLSVGASIPLDFWVTKAGVDSKDIAARQAGLDLEETLRTLELDVQATVYDLIYSARAVASAQKALDYAESHYQGVLEQFKLSAASSSDLSDAEVLVSASRKQLISARSQFLSNFSSLRTLAGLKTDALLVRIIP
jgi:outer membrane protein